VWATATFRKPTFSIRSQEVSPLFFSNFLEPDYKIEFRESLHHAAKDHTEKMLSNLNNNNSIESPHMMESIYVKNSLLNKAPVMD
jgi:hypothetical protein